MAYLNERLYKQCLDNNIAGVNLSINEQVDWNYGLEGACQGGHENLVLFMIEKGATAWNRGLYCACQGGHKDLALLMIKKGADDLNDGLYAACLRGHKDLVYLMIEKGANYFTYGSYGAFKGGHRELRLLMIEKGADIDRYLSPLSDDDIIFLIHRGFTNFGIYTKKAQMWRTWLQVARIELNNILIPDLTGIVASY